MIHQQCSKHLKIVRIPVFFLVIAHK